MKGSLRQMLEALRCEVVASRHGAAFVEARARHAELGGLSSIASVLEVLDDDRAVTYPRRDAISRAILVEHQRGGSTLWSSVLFVAFEPMIGRLQGRIIRGAHEADDIDQLIVSSFLATLEEKLPPNRVALHLRQQTQRKVFALLKQEQQRMKATSRLTELTQAESLVVLPEVVTRSEGFFDLVELLAEARRRRIPVRGIETILATMASGTDLRTFVNAHAPGDAVQRERCYQRLKKRRFRLLQRLRAMNAEAPQLALDLGLEGEAALLEPTMSFARLTSKREQSPRSVQTALLFTQEVPS